MTMTTNNPDPLEVWHEACGKYEDAAATGNTLRDGVLLGDQAAAAIIAQHYAPVIAENERLREALQNINRKASPDPERTMSEASNDLYWCACEARQALGAKP